MYRLGVLLVLFSCSSALFGQNLKIRGEVTEKNSNAPLSYATVRLLNENSELVSGTLSTENGSFTIETELRSFYIEIEYIGYQTFKTGLYQVSTEESTFKVGKLSLDLNTLELQELTVQGQKSSMEFQLDKKVFLVGQDLSALGGTTSDLLVNVPSVTVDPDGTVKLRGSSNVRILIDGQPSGLVSFKGGAGLKQLQASLVEKVEIITNPSAKYEAEGMAGIINIILKKEKKSGFNGNYEVVLGQPDNYGISTNFNYRKKKINFFLNYAFSYTDAPNRAGTSQTRLVDGVNYLLEQEDRGNVQGLNNNIRGGIDLYFSESSILTGSYLFSRSDGNRFTGLTYQDFIGSLNKPTALSTRVQEEKEIEPISEYVISYKKTFGKDGHSLNALFRFLDHWENSDQLFTEKFLSLDGSREIQRPSIQTSINDEFEKHYLFQLDYVQPIGKKGKLETGVRSSFRDMVNDFVVSDLQENGEYLPLPGFDNIFVYDENIHAAYGILGNETPKLSYQLGARLEYTDVETILEETKERNPRNYLNLFPSAHMVYHLSRDNDVQLSYSKRVQRPVYNSLSPFMTFRDSRNFWSGNPDLDPEFSDVVELGHLKFYDKSSFSTALYYRRTVDLIDQIRLLDETGFAISRPENLEGENVFGLDFNSDYKPNKWWKMDFNLNGFYASIDGSNIDPAYTASTWTWFARYNNRFQLKNNLDIQFRSSFDAPRKTAQGSRKSIYYFDLALSKQVLKDRGRINLSVSDILNSRINRWVAFGDGFTTSLLSQGRMRQANLSFNYKINQ